MSDSTGMSTPVTRGEMQAEFAQFEIRLEQRFAQLATKAELDEKIAQLATKAELDEKIAQLATKAELDEKIAQLATKAEIAPLATKVELELWGGALLARVLACIEAGERRMVERMDSGERRMVERMDSLEQRLLAELARHTKAISKSLWTQIAVIDEKYADLPPRVTKLEAKMFPTKRR